MLFASVLTFGQSIEKKWSFSSVTTTDGRSVIAIDSTDVLNLSKGNFDYSLVLKDSLKAKGNYIHQNNLLIFNYKQPVDTVRYYNVVELTDSALTLSEKNVLYKFSNTLQTTQEVTEVTEEVSDKIVPSQGFSMQSFGRGILGMLVLLIVAFLFSANRKGIDWKTVGLGLAFQLIIAIGVLKIPFVQKIFEWIGGLFVSVLDFTRAGSEFLFSGLVADMGSFGFIFAFQVLPTIIFFSALTSLLFYLGLIQKVVKGLAWLLSKGLKISGAESLSCCRKYFLRTNRSTFIN